MTINIENIAASRLKAGDEEAFNELYFLYHKRLYSFAFKYLKSQELAKDAVQDAFIKLWVNRKGITNSVKGFLFTAIRNHILNMIRNNKRRTLMNIQLEYRMKQPVNNTNEDILYSEYQKIVANALNELSDGKREIFELKSVQGLTNDEVVKKLGITIHTVKSQYYQATKHVRECLEEHADIRAKG